MGFRGGRAAASPTDPTTRLREANLAADYPENPVLVRIWRGGEIESIHRGAWVRTDGAGTVLDGQGHHDARFFVRSAIKSIQALPLLETGAAERFGFGDEELALALASHNGEACHTDRVRATLARLELEERHLRCGPQWPGDARTRREMVRTGGEAAAVHNNCSGKHAGFLALAKHLDVPLERYLDPESAGQVLVRDALADLTGVDAASLVPAIDGCSAPTYRLPLDGLATAFARLATPDRLPRERAAFCRRLTGAAAAHPVLIAGSQGRICTDLLRESGGRLFPKVGAEAVYAVGLRDGDQGLAVKIDDGAYRGMHAVVLALLERFGWLDARELERLGAWRAGKLTNRAGLTVGHVDTTLASTVEVRVS